MHIYRLAVTHLADQADHFDYKRKSYCCQIEEGDCWNCTIQRTLEGFSIKCQLIAAKSC